MAAAISPGGRRADPDAREVARTPPDSAELFIRPVAGGFYRTFPMHPAGGYQYAASLPATALPEGPYEFVITLFRGDSSVTFPSGLRRKPSDWDYSGGASWRFRVVGPQTPLRLFDPRSEEHTSELQSQSNLVCRLLLEKKKKHPHDTHPNSTSRHLSLTAPPPRTPLHHLSPP